MKTESSGARQMKRGQFSFQCMHSSLSQKGRGQPSQQDKLESQQTNIPSLMHPATVDIDGSKQTDFQKKVNMIASAFQRKVKVLL